MRLSFRLKLLAVFCHVVNTRGRVRSFSNLGNYLSVAGAVQCAAWEQWRRSVPRPPRSPRCDSHRSRDWHCSCDDRASWARRFSVVYRALDLHSDSPRRTLLPPKVCNARLYIHAPIIINCGNEASCIKHKKTHLTQFLKFTRVLGILILQYAFLWLQFEIFGHIWPSALINQPVLTRLLPCCVCASNLQSENDTHRTRGWIRDSQVSHAHTYICTIHRRILLAQYTLTINNRTDASNPLKKKNHYSTNSQLFSTTSATRL